jgi:hypothetical protein
MTATRTIIRDTIADAIIGAGTSVGDRVSRGRNRSYLVGSAEFPAAAILMPHKRMQPVGLGMAYRVTPTVTIELYLVDQQPSGSDPDRSLEEQVDELVDEIELALLRSQAVLALFDHPPSIESMHGSSAETAERVATATISVSGQISTQIAPRAPAATAWAVRLEADLAGPHGTAQDTETGPDGVVDVEQRFTFAPEES